MVLLSPGTGRRGGARQRLHTIQIGYVFKLLMLVVTELVKLVTKTFKILTLTIGNRCGDMSEIITPILLTWPLALGKQ